MVSPHLVSLVGCLLHFADFFPPARGSKVLKAAEQGHPLALRSPSRKGKAIHPLESWCLTALVDFSSSGFYFSFGPRRWQRGEEQGDGLVFRSSLVLEAIGRPFLPTQPQFVIGWRPARCLQQPIGNSVPSLNAQTASTFKRTHHLSNSQTSQHLQHAVHTAHHIG